MDSASRTFLSDVPGAFFRSHLPRGDSGARHTGEKVLAVVIRASGSQVPRPCISIDERVHGFLGGPIEGLWQVREVLCEDVGRSALTAYTHEISGTKTAH